MDTVNRTFLTELFEAAVAAADPAEALRGHLPEKPAGRTIVIGAGKGAAQLAAAFEEAWEDPVEGIVVTRYGYAVPCRHLEVIEAAHPVPDQAGAEATQKVLALLDGLSADDLVVALITGGGSALLAAPPEGLTLEDEQGLNRALLASGAPIGAMNAVRKQVSRVKGGRLAAAAAPARVVSLIVSDVPGDAPSEVASGPTVPSRTGRAEAMAAIRTYGIAVPERVRSFLETAPEDAPAPDDDIFAHNEVRVIASAARSLEAAGALAEIRGIPAVILSDAMEGEAREVARVQAAIAREVLRRDRPFPKPVLILSGGETTVTLRGKGRGGRNSEFLLSFALEMEGWQGVAAIAADTDGIDGSENNAGAFADGNSTAEMRAAGVDPAEALAGNDAYTAFEAAELIFAPGPTGTNVNDFRAILLR
ncbi:glycerate kinase [Pseudooceanicola sediminis]|uniref:Glycerate kinase n=1 Tax=Pseudooceanicola sediminis TaxID=2211117 RepID=A0A399IYR6_9RHOB|nr:glycerate kinase [Pseudooceanicola sediminis]KAA2313003.1 glycerate kinase [Puniceibacterium sp. HSS470]RII37597.1 glycerate kinase [Pseudooceanicola sediminis]|tara:strand:- start:45442 stop:46704 length:1263 start_codon:yes stop_codon:yes gene_type:complete